MAETAHVKSPGKVRSHIAGISAAFLCGILLLIGDSPTTGRLADRLASLAQQMGRPASSADAAKTTNLQIGELASQLNTYDAETLSGLARDPNADRQERFLAVYLISQRPEEFVRQLGSVALTAEVTESNKDFVGDLEIHKQFELSLRVQALLALDRLNSSGHHVEQAEFFDRLLQRPPEGSVILATLAMIGAAGFRQHRSLMSLYLGRKLQNSAKEWADETAQD